MSDTSNPQQLTGLELRQEVAGIIGYKVSPCTRIMAGRDDEGFELILPDGRSWGPWRPTEAMVRECDCPRFESNPAHLQEMVNHLRANGFDVKITQSEDGRCHASAHKVGENWRAEAYDPSQITPAVAQLLVGAMAEKAERQEGAGNSNGA